MTRDYIIRMAREAQIGDSHGYVIQNELEHLERFATLVAAAEREECAKVCDAEEQRVEKLQDIVGESSDEPAQFLTGKAMAARSLAAAIRARRQ